MPYDNKAQLTKQAMHLALKKLITSKSINKITIKDITDACGLNRQTFYYHFQDIYDLLEWSFRQEFRFLEDYLQKPDNTWEEFLAGVIAYIGQNKYVCQCIIDGMAREQLSLSLHNSVYEIIKKIILHVNSDEPIPPKYLDFTARFYTYALSGYLLDWVKGGMQETPEQIIDNFRFVIGHHRRLQTSSSRLM